MAQDEVEGAVRGGVEGLAGVEGEDVVGPSTLELSLRHEQGRAGFRAGEGPLLPSGPVFYKRGGAARHHTPPHRLAAVSSVGGQG